MTLTDLQLSILYALTVDRVLFISVQCTLSDGGRERGKCPTSRKKEGELSGREISGGYVQG